MARRIVTYDCTFGEADGASMVGKIVHIYTNFAQAQARNALGFASVYSVNLLTGVIGAAITQARATATTAATGPTVNVHGALVVGLDDAEDEYWLLCENSGRWGSPRRLVIFRQDEASTSSSSLSSASSASSSSESSSSASSESSASSSSESSASSNSSSESSASSESSSESSASSMSSSQEFSSWSSSSTPA